MAESPSVSPSISPSRSLSPSASESKSASRSISPSPSTSPSVSPSESPSVSPSVSPSESPSVSPSLSPSASASPSASRSLSPSPSESPSISASPSLSISASPSLSISASPSLSPSLSQSVSPSASLSPSASPSPGVNGRQIDQEHLLVEYDTGRVNNDQTNILVEYETTKVDISQTLILVEDRVSPFKMIRQEHLLVEYDTGSVVASQTLILVEIEAPAIVPCYITITTPYSIVAEYYVRIKDKNSNVVMILDDWVALEYQKEVDAVGYAVLQMFSGDTRFDLLSTNYLVEVWRRLPGVGGTWYIDFVGLIGKLARTQNQGMEKLNVECVGLNDILARRSIAWRQGDIESDKNAAAETAMKEYVNENCGPAATSTTTDPVLGGGLPRLLAGTIPGFTVDTDLGRGAVWSGMKGLENLLDTVQEIAEFAAMDFSVENTGPGQFCFYVYPNQLGTDRTTYGLNPYSGLNAAGNPPVIFSTELATAADMSYSLDRRSEKNAVIVLGTSERSTQLITVRTSPAAFAGDMLEQREMVLNESGLEFEFQREDAGDAALEDNRYKETLDFEPMQQPALLYGKDYFLGDKVTALYRTIQLDKRIMVVKVNLSKGEQKVTLTVKDVPRK